MLWIATVDEMKGNLGITDTTDDQELQRKMEAMQGRFDDKTRRKLALSADVEIFDGALSELFLRRYPIVAISTIHIDVDQAWDADSLLESDDYRYDAAMGRVVYGVGTTRWPSGFQAIRITYTGGYVAAGSTPGAGQTAMPEGIRRAFFMQFEFEWRNKTTLGNQSMSAQGVNISMAPAKFLPDVEEALIPFTKQV